ncbi:MAG TPA: glycosyltransferase [Alphaproteobacteria bacterium]|nr:glycosyltransferase [Alphaproteobacteria bacterium]
MPKISVVTAVYNGAKFLPETIGSILAQTFSDLEYILVDDASSDSSVEVIHSFQDPRIRLLVNDTNSRLVQTRNRGIGAARGQYIALSDHDDISVPTRLADQVRFLEANPDIGMVGTWYGVINLTGDKLPKRMHRRYDPDECKVSLLYRNPFGNSTLLIRREALPDPPYAPEFPLCEDYRFIVRVSRKHRIAILPKVTVYYRVTKSSYSNFTRTQTFELAKTIKLELLRELGVEPSERELDIHQNLEMDHLPPNRSLLAETRHWLERLVAANEHSRVYDPRAFATITGNEWFERCRTYSHLGPQVWTEFRRSPLAQRSHYERLERLKLRLKCMLGGLLPPYSR